MPSDPPRFGMLCIPDCVGIRTHVHTHTWWHESGFKKPGAGWPVAANYVLKQRCITSYVYKVN